MQAPCAMAPCAAVAPLPLHRAVAAATPASQRGAAAAHTLSRAALRPRLQCSRRGTRCAVAASAAPVVPRGPPAPLPTSYAMMTEQVQAALQAALDDGVPLMEVQFPPAGLNTVPGDAEGNVESNLIVAFMRDFCRVWARDAALIKRVRVFFPDKTELALALGGAARSSDGIPAPDNTFTPGPFANFPGRCTWLCQPGLLTTSGLGKLLGTHEPASARTAADDAAYVIAYPSLNLDEMSEVAALYEQAAAPRGVPLLTVNAELERIRSGYYPAFWARDEMAVLRQFVPRFQQIYFLHNFKGSNPAVLFRAYPGPFQVLLRAQDGAMTCVHTCDDFPGLRAVATEILPAAIAAARRR